LRSPNLWIAHRVGLAAGGAGRGVRGLLATRLRDIYFAITTLVFSQIFYVIIFTWTEVTGVRTGSTSPAAVHDPRHLERAVLDAEPALVRAR